LAIKPGLWERTSTMQQPGMPAMAMPPEMANMPPEKRAQMEKMMGMMSGKPTTTRECITPEMLQRWEDYARQQSQGQCTHEVRERTPQKVSMTVTCDGGRSTGTMEFLAPAPERMTSTVQMLHKTPAGERSMKLDSDARWLGADCGEVKPPQ
jgi:hypothetical protein